MTSTDETEFGSAPASELDARPSHRRARISVIVPAFNKLPFLGASLGSIVAACNQYVHAEVIMVVNGSTDGSFELVQSRFAKDMRVLSAPGLKVGALRNLGAREASGEILSFIDADCVVPLQYFHALNVVFENRRIDATGRTVSFPTNGSWVERVWGDLNRRSSGPQDYINSGNFAVRRSAFEAVGGFSEDLVTDEDTELGLRLRASGFSIVEVRELDVLHLDNPKTIGQFFRKEVWHAQGMFATKRYRRVDRPTAMMFVHLLLAISAVLSLVLVPGPWYARVVLAAGLSLLVPAATAGFRMMQLRRWISPLRATTLYWVYFAARLVSLLQISTRGRWP